MYEKQPNFEHDESSPKSNPEDLQEQKSKEDELTESKEEPVQRLEEDCRTNGRAEDLGVQTNAEVTAIEVKDGGIVAQSCDKAAEEENSRTEEKKEHLESKKKQTCDGVEEQKLVGSRVGDVFFENYHTSPDKNEEIDFVYDFMTPTHYRMEKQRSQSDKMIPSVPIIEQVSSNTSLKAPTFESPEMKKSYFGLMTSRKDGRRGTLNGKF